jgi:hypothetical protein
VQQELKERMNRNRIVIPQVFVEGQLLGVSHTLFYFLLLSLSLSHVRNDRLSPAQTLEGSDSGESPSQLTKCARRNLSNDLVNFLSLSEGSAWRVPFISTSIDPPGKINIRCGTVRLTYLRLTI